MQFFIFSEDGYDVSNAMRNLKTIGVRASSYPANMRSISSMRRVRIDVALIFGEDKTMSAAAKFLRASHIDCIIVCCYDKPNSLNLLIPQEANDYLTEETLQDEAFLLKAKTWLELCRIKSVENAEFADGKNAFGVKVWDRRVRFKIHGDPSLELFWEYFLNDRRFDNIRHTASWVQACHTICVKLLEDKQSPTVFLEENDDYFLLTIVNIEEDGDYYDMLADYAGLDKLRFVGHIYKKTKGLFSLHLRKKTPFIETKKVVEQKRYRSTGLQIDKAADYIKESGITKEDLSDIKGLESELKESLESCEERDKLRIYGEFFKNYALEIGHLMEFEALRDALKELGETLANLQNEFYCDKALYFADTICEDLSLWISHVFILQDAQNIHYLDSSLTSSCDYIKALVKGEEISYGEELELF